MKRREFAKVMGAVAAGLAAGSVVRAQDKPADKAEKHICKGHNSCKGTAILDDPPGPLSTMRYEGCAGGAEVRMIRIDGLGHRWTREEVDTTTVMWQFFKSHRRDR